MLKINYFFSSVAQCVVSRFDFPVDIHNIFSPYKSFPPWIPAYSVADLGKFRAGTETVEKFGSGSESAEKMRFWIQHFLDSDLTHWKNIWIRIRNGLVDNNNYRSGSPLEFSHLWLLNAKQLRSESGSGHFFSGSDPVVFSE